MRRFGLALVTLGLLVFARGARADDAVVRAFSAPVDAVSVLLPRKDTTADVRWKENGTWSAWRTVAVEDEQDPSLLTSQLLVLPEGVREIALRGEGLLQPLTVSKALARYAVAAKGTVPEHNILTRKEWGADESLRYASATPSSQGSREEDAEDIPDTSRESDCLDAQASWPAEFKTSPPVTKDKGGYLRWPHTYSTEIKLLVVHHTAQDMTVKRTGIDRMRALYAYHAQNRGWGDIGYHYVIDDRGQIYEGKAGGDFVVGGHAYCNNASTIGIALMGNFDLGPPTRDQTESLQWLLAKLSGRYEINLTDTLTVRGKRLPAVVGHRNLLSTDCPGLYLFGALDQIREHVRTGDTTATVTYRAPAASSSRSSASVSRPSVPSRLAGHVGFSALGSTVLEGRPGGEIIIPVLYTAGGTGVKRGASLGEVWRAPTTLAVWQEHEGTYERVRRDLTSPALLTRGASVMVRIKVQVPLDRHSFTLKIGDVTYVVTASGRRLRTPGTTSSYQEGAPATVSGVSGSSSSSSSFSTVRSRPRVTSRPPVPENVIRVRLSDSASFSQVTLSTDGEAKVNETGFPGRTLTLTRSGNLCVAAEDGRTKSHGILRIVSDGGSTTLTSWQKNYKRFRGTLECRVIDGELVLINELPLEDYLLGLGEEPDTEPLEKQKAFAVAARTYALWYLHPDHRKFPGKPYDGSDSPAEFQVYSGADFETKNPRWTQAVRATSELALRIDGEPIKPPYFSSDDGRTRSPAEAGWNSFPHAQIFASKPDPWCQGQELRGHGVGMSGCGAEAQAHEGRTYREILAYYYPGTTIE